MKLHHKIYGTGDPVIILHGLFGMGDNWRNIARLMESQYQCIMVDLRNHGRSPHDPVMNFMVMTDDILELMNDLGLDKTTVMGHSMGGKVAMQLALNHSSKVDKLIVVDIAPKFYPPHHDAVIDAIQSFDPGTLKERSEAEDAFARVLGNNYSIIQFLMKNLTRLPHGGFEWKPNMPVIIDAYNHLVEDVTFYQPYYGPTLFVRGENSGYILDEDLGHIRELFPNLHLSTIPGAGHWVHADAPGPFTGEVLAFLSDQLSVN
jgi:pimeloyl-ACP methyl ester carboxylesterase